MSEAWGFSVWHDPTAGCAVAESSNGESLSVKIYHDDPATALERALDYAAKPFRADVFDRMFKEYLDGSS